MKGKTGKLVIFGAGLVAEVAYEYFTHDSPYEVVAFTVHEAFLKRDSLFNRPVVPFQRVEEIYRTDACKMFVAAGFGRLNRDRAALYQEARRKGYVLASYVSSRAFVWRNVQLGDNCFIHEHNVLQPFVRVGNNVTLWSGNHIGHHSVIRNHCFISSHVVVSGCTEVGEYCFLGVNSAVGDNLVVARDCFVGPGAVIRTNTEPGKMYTGPSARVRRIGALQYFKVREEAR